VFAERTGRGSKAPQRAGPAPMAGSSQRARCAPPAAPGGELAERHACASERVRIARRFGRRAMRPVT